MKPASVIAVAGGGAAGFFAAIACAESLHDCTVIVLEKSPEPLAKVMISGGGRCNVTHACFDPARLVEAYPRGRRELLGPFHRWQPRDTVRWFEGRGVKLKTEPDGRMFPVTDQSSSVVQCLLHEAREAGVQFRPGCALTGVERRDQGFQLHLTGGKTLDCDRLLIATGGNQNSPVFGILSGLGHTIAPLRPSLFSFHCDDPRLRELAGISVPDVEVQVPGTNLLQRGALLVTHWGLSGPAILKLSAWGAVELADRDYRFPLRIRWVPGLNEQTLREQIASCRTAHGRKAVHKINLWNMPQRLWQAMIEPLGLAPDVTWNQFPKAALAPLIQTILGAEFEIDGKSMNKEEFVTCGGVSLDEVDFKTMESRLCRGLYFAGEVLDIDGITGGFNFQSAWTTGWIAGKSMGREI